MALSAFSDKTKQPQDTDLSATLGSTFPLWKQLEKNISERFAPVTVEWGCSSKKTGWGLRLKQPKQAILYLIPCKGYFWVSFALGEKAVKTAHTSGLPLSVLEVIDAAPKYAEGRGVRLEVRSAQDVATIEQLAAIKMKK